MLGSVDAGAGTAGDAEASALVDLDADAGRLLVLRVEQRHVRDVDAALALDHAGDGVRTTRRRTLMALDDVEAFDVDTVLGRVDAQHSARLALVLARDHDDLVVLAD